jgi:cytochrome P450
MLGNSTEPAIPATDLRRAFDPISEAYIRDPAGALRNARDTAPVFYSDKMQCWVVTRYAEVQAALMDFSSFSNDRSTRWIRQSTIRFGGWGTAVFRASG